MNRVDLVVVGNLLIDEFPGCEPQPGGAALYAALAARSCGLEVAVHSVVGEDYPLERLEQAGVKLSLERLSGPGGRAVMSYGPDGRSLEHQGPGHEAMTPRRPHPFRTSFVHLAPMPRTWQLFHLEHAEEGTALLDPYPWMDLDYLSALRSLEGKLRALLLNQEELQMPFEQIDLACWTLLKRGEEGGRSVNPDLSWQPWPVEMVDPTGAGDAFAAGLAAGLVRGETPQDCLARAARTAAKALSASGCDGLS